MYNELNYTCWIQTLPIYITSLTENVICNYIIIQNDKKKKKKIKQKKLLVRRTFVVKISYFCSVYRILLTSEI